MSRPGKIYVGTSGWSYKGWHDTFYPSECGPSQWFSFYAGRFATVEINATFYRLPSEKMVEGWRTKAPAGFRYALKGSRFITHLKKLKEPASALEVFFDRIEPLRSKMAVVLWQLPPQLRKNMGRIESFLDCLPASYRYAIEFRHPSWLDEEVFRALRARGIANVWVSSRQMPVDYTVTAGFIYLRFHGLAGGFGHNYTRAELQPWADQLVEHARQGRPSYVYFNNDWNARAPENAEQLMAMVEPWAVRAGHRTSGALPGRS